MTLTQIAPNNTDEGPPGLCSLLEFPDLMFDADDAAVAYMRAVDARGVVPPEVANLPDVRDARRVCLSCELADTCLEGALERREPHGMWGGLITPERNAILRQRQNAHQAARKRAQRSYYGQTEQLPGL